MCRSDRLLAAGDITPKDVEKMDFDVSINAYESDYEIQLTFI